MDPSVSRGTHPRKKSGVAIQGLWSKIELAKSTQRQARSCCLCGCTRDHVILLAAGDQGTGAEKTSDGVFHEFKNQVLNKKLNPSWLVTIPDLFPSKKSVSLVRQTLTSLYHPATGRRQALLAQSDVRVTQ